MEEVGVLFNCHRNISRIKQLWTQKGHIMCSFLYCNHPPEHWCVCFVLALLGRGKEAFASGFSFLWYSRWGSCRGMCVNSLNQCCVKKTNPNTQLKTTLYRKIGFEPNLCQVTFCRNLLTHQTRWKIKEILAK